MAPIASALIFSVLLNGILVTIGLTVAPRHPSSAAVRLAELLTDPATQFAEWAAPRGHDVAHAVGIVVIAIASSVLFYAALAWSALKLLAWLRNRKPESVDLFTK